jgi:hypothetical protein
MTSSEVIFICYHLGMKQWRISKYNPGLRDNSGAFQGDDWIMLSDIGNEFNSKQLTIEDYMRTEDEYVTIANALLEASGVPYLSVEQLKMPKSDVSAKEVASKYGLYEEIHLAEGQQIKSQQALHAVRLMLRELFWCKLEFKNRFFIHIGWDYYMYIGTMLDDSEFTKILINSVLYAEPLESPYRK